MPCVSLRCVAGLGQGGVVQGTRRLDDLTKVMKQYEKTRVAPLISERQRVHRAKKKNPSGVRV